jgi:hypothetical protein
LCHFVRLQHASCLFDRHDHPSTATLRYLVEIEIWSGSSFALNG